MPTAKRSTDLTNKPSYLGLLNAIALAESRAHKYLMVWADSTRDPGVRQVLKRVALREGEHGMAFAKRIDELGFDLRDKEDPGFEERMAIASSEVSDLEKMEKLRLDKLETDVLTFFDTVFKDHSIDIGTGALLGRYIAEEHDSARLLRSCNQALKDQPPGRSGRGRRGGAKEASAAPARPRRATG